MELINAYCSHKQVQKLDSLLPQMKYQSYTQIFKKNEMLKNKSIDHPSHIEYRLQHSSLWNIEVIYMRTT